MGSTLARPEPPRLLPLGYLQNNVYRNNPQTIPDLKAAIAANSRAIPRKEFVRVIENFARRVCRRRGGANLEHIFERQ